MSKLVLVKIIMLAALLLHLPITYAASDVSFGKIKGQVDFCNSGGYEGMQIYVPGRQFIVVTGSDGKFIFDYVPVGTYSLYYSIAGSRVNRNDNIRVRKDKATDLSLVSFCQKVVESPQKGSIKNSNVSANRGATCKPGDARPQCIDADGDGVVANQDCNDADSNIRPGAIEICDGVDNDCNNRIDDIAEILVDHGTGQCSEGKIIVSACDEGFSDCDAVASNGCEIDTMNDIDHCGACENACSALEMCNLGIC